MVGKSILKKATRGENRLHETEVLYYTACLYVCMCMVLPFVQQTIMIIPVYRTSGHVCI